VRRALAALALSGLCALVASAHPALFNEIAQYVIVRFTGGRVLVTYQCFANDRSTYASSAAEEAQADVQSGYTFGVHQFAPQQQKVYFAENRDSLGRGVAVIVNGATLALSPVG